MVSIEELNNAMYQYRGPAVSLTKVWEYNEFIKPEIINEIKNADVIYPKNLFGSPDTKPTEIFILTTDNKLFYGKINKKLKLGLYNEILDLSE